MRLESVDGRQLELRIDGYQFGATMGPRDGFDWDANWLIIVGNLQLPDGRQHTFRDPCLTTVECAELADWLDQRGSEDVRPSGQAGDDYELDLVFTEPCIAFHLMSTAADEVVLRVYLSLEAEPPWPIDGSKGLFENYTTLILPRTDVVAVSAAWRHELSSYPRR